jgi:hypothetical protein
VKTDEDLDAMLEDLNLEGGSLDDLDDLLEEVGMGANKKKK